MSNIIERTKEYYDSQDADEFYFTIWGGEDIHIGLYQRDENDIFRASRRTVQAMLEQLPQVDAQTKILDIGSGYGGSARLLASQKNCFVECLNLSQVQNERNRQMNEEQGLSEKIHVTDGNFESLPYDDDSFDVVWCQDSLLHSGDRFLVFQEVDRVLKANGHFIFTDPMQKLEADPDQLQPVLDRIHLSSMGSIETYGKYASELGWKTIKITEFPNAIETHYSQILQNLESREDELQELCSDEYRANMKKGLRHWIEAGKNGVITWGMLQFSK